MKTQNKCLIIISGCMLIIALMNTFNMQRPAALDLILALIIVTNTGVLLFSVMKKWMRK